jgi:hypothetical protein
MIIRKDKKKKRKKKEKRRGIEKQNLQGIFIYGLLLQKHVLGPLL